MEENQEVIQVKTRREFLISGAASVGAALGAYSSPVRSVLGSQDGINRPAGSPTAKDYIQDGLVAMWDGIENAGWGTHNSSATTWKDLLGGQELEFSGTTVNADSVGFVTGAYVYSNGNIGLTTANTLQGEICIDIQSPPDNRQYAQFAGSNTRISHSQQEPEEEYR